MTPSLPTLTTHYTYYKVTNLLCSFGKAHRHAPFEQVAPWAPLMEELDGAAFTEYRQGWHRQAD